MWSAKQEQAAAATSLDDVEAKRKRDLEQDANRR